MCPSAFTVSGSPGSEGMGPRSKLHRNLPWTGGDVCAKFYQDLYKGIDFHQPSTHQQTKKRTPVHTFLYILANQALALPGKNLMRLRHPSGHFTLHKVFSPLTRLDFGV